MDESKHSTRRWGDDSALFDEDEARRRLLDATGRCIVRAGGTRIQVGDVADEAGVSRSTVYRYFSSRDALVQELMAVRSDAALERIVTALPDPHDAWRCLPELVLAPVRLVEGNPLNEALFTPESRALMMVSPSGLGGERSVDVAVKHLGPLIERWQATGQVHADLDVRETVRWINTVAFLLLTPPWSAMTEDERRTFTERYLVRALVAGRGSSRPRR